MKRHIMIVLAVAIAITAAGCGKKKRTAHVPVAPRAEAAPMPRIGDEEVGTASWYGHPYHGRRASNGEIYDMEKLTAAHRTMPFGTIVEVRNLSNAREVQVRITDRGPFVGDRIIDLSHAAAREIQMIGPGTAKVRLRVVGLPQVSPGGYFAVQVGAFRERGNAEKLQQRLAGEYGTARVLMRDAKPALWRVLVGHETSEAGASAVAARLKKEVGPAFVVRVDAPESNL
ncbi:MAG TPA: septal ring lytic transglycosylase RlpA family protein [Bryobacteraceae bacterium]|nr:septal ring lytic transglycosylase RlpA family protein [Bryobacteraceae bacterium]